MSGGDKLPRDLVWEGAHLSQIALTAMADGQESIVEDGAVDHVDTCEWCAGRLGRVALLSCAVGQALGDGATRSPAQVARKAGNAWVAMAMGLVVSVVAAAPMLAKINRLASLAMVFFTHGVPVLARGGVALATNETVSRALPAATLMSSALLVAMGWAIARAWSRSSEGSVS